MILFEIRINEKDQDCIAITHGPTGGFVSIPVVRNETDCQDEQNNCYHAEEPVENIKCDEFGRDCCHHF